ncbi:MAG: DUF3500 domain-containing protein [Planctomycetales bacterium]
MTADRHDGPDSNTDDVSRRQFIKTAAGTALAASALTPSVLSAADKSAGIAAAEVAVPETVVGQLYETLSDAQKKIVCFDWDHQDKRRGLLRTFIANNWNVTKAEIKSDFFTGQQQALVREIFEGIIHPEWHERIDKQLDDDAGGFGVEQSLAIFGEPGSDQFEFVLTGRHMTLRCDGNTAPHVAFGGPIFYGHAPDNFHEDSDHPGNVFWPQALAANEVYKMLDGRQRALALVEPTPPERRVPFLGTDGERPGIPLTEMSDDQKAEMQKVLGTLIEPYRQTDQDEVRLCLKAQGGLDKCNLAFYKDKDIGDDGVWDNWRLEGPSFVWYFRGSPHVHVWAHVADNPDVELNS